MSQRLEKVNDLIRDHVSQLIEREVSWKPGMLVTVTRVDTSPDLRHTRVLVSVFPAGEQAFALKTLEHELYRLQGALNHRLHMKPLPRLQFVADETEAQAQAVEDLLGRIAHEE